MSAENDIAHTAQDVVGKGKEAVGKVIGNDELVAEGKADQAAASVKKGVEDVKDGVKDVFDAK